MSTKMVSILEIPLDRLTDQDLINWSVYLASDVKQAGTGWMARDEIIRMANEIVRLRALSTKKFFPASC